MSNGWKTPSVDKWGLTSAKFCEVFLKKKADSQNFSFGHVSFPISSCFGVGVISNHDLVDLFVLRDPGTKTSQATCNELLKLRLEGFGPRPTPPNQKLLRRRRQTSQKKQKTSQKFGTKLLRSWRQTSQKFKITTYASPWAQQPNF